jgi:sirohydrochlorin ferrochelatase
VIPILVAHGTRKAHGVAMVGALAERVSAALGRDVRTAFVDVLGPTPSEVLAGLNDHAPAVLVPAFLSSGYHVRHDLPAHVAASGHRNAVVTAPWPPRARRTSARNGTCG